MDKKKLPVDLEELHATFSKEMSKDVHKYKKAAKNFKGPEHYMLDVHHDLADNHLKEPEERPKHSDSKSESDDSES